MNYAAKRLPVVAAFVLVVVVSYGCSGGGKAAIAPGQMYDPEALQEFVARTGPPSFPTSEYRIQVGDRLDFTFLYHTNLTTRSVLVRDDGRISLPYVGDQMAAGFTPMGLDSVLTEKYAEILKQPNLTVSLASTSDRQVYVLGYVGHAGGFKFDRSISLVQALALAGGVSDGAKPQNTILIRRDGDEVVGIEVDVKSIIEGRSVGSDIPLRNYDIVYVPKSRLKSVEEFSESVGKIIGLPLGTTLQGWQIANSVEQYRYFRLRNEEDNNQ